MRSFKIQEYDVVEIDLSRINRDQVYVVEVALDGKVCAGTEAILKETNICAIPVRKSVAMGTHVPFSDKVNEREALIGALRKLYRMGHDRTLRLPSSGIGAGPYGLATHSPKIYGELCQILADHFGYQQPFAVDDQSTTSEGSSRPYHHEIFGEVCTRGGLYMTQQIAERHGLTIEQLKAHCLTAANELQAQGRLFPLHRPIYRWASEE